MEHLAKACLATQLEILNYADRARLILVGPPRSSREEVGKMTVDLSWNRGDRVVHWNYAEQNVRKEFDLPIQCAVYIANPSSVVIVEGIQSSGPRNAVVFDLDGQERVRLRPPRLPALMGFDQVFQSRTEVVAVVVTRQGDFHGTPDLITGELRNLREWR